jgi:hypothetical protein
MRLSHKRNIAWHNPKIICFSFNELPESLKLSGSFSAKQNKNLSNF